MRPVLDMHAAKVTVELTNRCNLRCRMCPMNRLQRPQADMPWSLVERIAADLAGNGIQVSWLHELGEPLLYPRLADAVDLFPGAAVSTNAVTLDGEMGRSLLTSSLQRIRLCIDTVNPTVYRSIRRGGIFEEVAANIRTFLELSEGHPITVEIQRLITLQTVQESVDDFADFFHLERYPQARIIEKTCEGLDTADATDLHESFYGCFQGDPFGYLVVLADGRVTHCCYDSEGEQILGDLRTQTLAEIVASETAAGLVDAFRRRDWDTLPRCGECHRNPTARAVVLDRLQQLGHRLDRVLPVKRVARKIINR